MLGKPEAIVALNKMLYNELTAIDQYFLHARMLRHWGLHDLGAIIYKESIGEMRHADWLIERILFLDGLPNLQDLGKLRIGENALEALQSDLALETVARDDTASSITLFESLGDYVSRDIATKILIDSEEHVDFLERQLDLVKQLGLQNYLQSAMGPMERTRCPSGADWLISGLALTALRHRRTAALVDGESTQRRAGIDRRRRLFFSLSALQTQTIIAATPDTRVERPGLGAPNACFFGMPHPALAVKELRRPADTPDMGRYGSGGPFRCGDRSLAMTASPSPRAQNARRRFWVKVWSNVGTGTGRLRASRLESLRVS